MGIFEKRFERKPDPKSKQIYFYYLYRCCMLILTNIDYFTHESLNI